MDDNNKSLINEGEIDLLQLITELWNKKALIIFLTTIAAIISVLYSLSLPNIYRSQALLAPADSQSQGCLRLEVYQVRFDSWNLNSWNYDAKKQKL